MYSSGAGAYTNSPYTYFGNNGEVIDDDDDTISVPLQHHRASRGKRWSIELWGNFLEKTDVPPGAGTDWTTATDLMRCMVCFDVKKEDAELKKGHKGIGGCGQKIKSITYN